MYDDMSICSDTLPALDTETDRQTDRQTDKDKNNVKTISFCAYIPC